MHARTHAHLQTALTAATALASAGVASAAATVVANSATAKAVARSAETVRLKNVVIAEALAAKTLEVATAVAEAAITVAVASISSTGNSFNIFTKEWVPKKSTKCVAKKAVVRQTSTRCTERQGAWGSRRATVTVKMQRGTVSQCLVVKMQGVSMDIMEIHQNTDSRFQASTAPSSYFLVAIAFFSLQWRGRLSRVAGRRGFLARLYVGQRPLSITRPFHALPIVLALVAAALVLMPLVHAASAALIAATAALSAANIAYTALLSAIQVEATATAAATLVHTHIYHMSIYIPRRWIISG